jgi:hypothetical protein
MSRLAYIGRPWVAFDPEDKQHRKYFAEFQENRTWGKCPIRFIISDDAGDLLSMMQRRLVGYYTATEFNVQC